MPEINFPATVLGAEVMVGDPTAEFKKKAQELILKDKQEKVPMHSKSMSQSFLIRSCKLGPDNYQHLPRKHNPGLLFRLWVMTMFLIHARQFMDFCTNCDCSPMRSSSKSRQVLSDGRKDGWMRSLGSPYAHGRFVSM